MNLDKYKDKQTKINNKKREEGSKEIFFAAAFYIFIFAAVYLFEVSCLLPRKPLSLLLLYLHTLKTTNHTPYFSSKHLQAKIAAAAAAAAADLGPTSALRLLLLFCFISYIKRKISLNK